MRPKQITSNSGNTEPDLGGWSIFFHPDLIRVSSLSNSIPAVFFLWLWLVTKPCIYLKKKKIALTAIIQKIEIEINQNIDEHTQEIIIHNIESLLKYSQRYFDRQFLTRKNLSKDFVIKFEKYLLTYFESNLPSEKGIPSVQECGENLGMSGKYLSDLLKKETGRSITEHIHLHIVEKAKNELLNSNIPISQIAFSLGFDYPQHFSKIFKNNAGVSPKEYRSLN